MRTLKLTLLMCSALMVAAIPIWAGPLVMTVNNDATALANMLIGSPGISLVSATLTAANGAAGTFTGGTGILPFESGIVLGSGNINSIPGPNNEPGTSTDFGTPGDPALTALSGFDTYDAAILEFTFIPSSDVISFRFVFSSEEYNEFVGTEFNDVFAFFLNGTNIALIPGTATPITINTVNNGSNSAYYTDNTGGGLDIEMDGLAGIKLALYATGTVTAGVENTIRLAIADAGDEVLDSAVFLQASSFVPEPPPIPEPGAVVLLGAGLGAVALYRRRRQA